MEFDFHDWVDSNRVEFIIEFIEVLEYGRTFSGFCG